MTLECLYRDTESSVDLDGRVINTFRERYRFESAERLTPKQALANQSYLPFQSHVDDPFAYLRKGKAVEVSGKRNPWWYEFDLEWSSEIPSQPQQDPSNPAADPIEMEIGGNERMVAVYRDRNGKAILNSAKDFFSDPAIERPITTIYVRVTRSVLSFTPADAFAIADRVNSDAYLAATTGQLKMGAPVGRLVPATGQRPQHWRVTYTMLYDPLGWQPKVLDQGLRRLNDDDQLVPILDKEGLHPITEPVPLDGAGQPVPPEELPDGAHFNEFEVLLETSFASLGLI